MQDDDGKTYIVGYEHRGGIDGMIDAELTSWAVIPETVGQYTGLLDKNGLTSISTPAGKSNLLNSSVVC